MSPAPVVAQESNQGEPLDGARIWSELIREIKSQRPLILSWLQAGHLLDADGQQLRVGFAPGQRMFVESLNKANNRKLLEATLAKIAGRSIGLKLELMAADPAPASAAAKNGAHPDEEADHAPDSSPDAPPVDPAESFKNDPLIQKALKIFEGEIRSVEGPA